MCNGIIVCGQYKISIQHNNDEQRLASVLHESYVPTICANMITAFGNCTQVHYWAACQYVNLNKCNCKCKQENCCISEFELT